jgi:predicted flap endonuclease-1-like 5' DNA nuclease
VFWFIAQSVFVILLAFLLGVLVGTIWLRPRRDLDAVDPWQVSPAPAVATASPAVPGIVADVSDAARAANGWPAADRRDPSASAEDDADPAAGAASAETPPPVPRRPAETGVPAQLDLPQTDPEPDDAPAEQAGPAPARPTVATRAAWDSDRLEQIEGIGPKIADALRAAGITTLAALAEADEATLRSALVAANVRPTSSLPTWPQQARLLAVTGPRTYAGLSGRLTPGRDASGVG